MWSWQFFRLAAGAAVERLLMDGVSWNDPDLDRAEKKANRKSDGSAPQDARAVDYGAGFVMMRA
jgi:hypothetical protein